MIIKKTVQYDSNYAASLTSGNSAWWNSNVDAIIAPGPILASTYSWYTGKAIPTVSLHGEPFMAQYPLKDTDGVRINNFEGKAIRDFRVPGALLSYISYCQSLVDLGADGVYIQGVTLQDSKNFVKENGEEILGNFNWYQSAIIEFLETLQSEMKQYKPNFLVIHEVDWQDLKPIRWEHSMVRRQIKSCDAVYLRNIPTDLSLNKYSAQNPAVDYRQYSLRSLLTYVDYVHEQGTNVWYGGDNSTADSQKFSSAVYRLTYAYGDHLSVNGQYAPAAVNSVFTTNYGNPLGRRKDQYEDPNNAGFIQRDFHAGKVTVYPADPVASADLSVSGPTEVSTFPKAGILDGFDNTQTVGNNYVTEEFAQAWEMSSTAFRVATTSSVGTSGAQQVSMAYLAEFSRDQEVYVSRVGTSPIFLRARAQDPSNFYSFYADGASCKIQKTVNGVTTDLASQTVAIFTNSTLGLRLNGNTLQGYVNGNLTISATDTTFAAGGKIAVRMNTTATDSIQLFGGGNLATDTQQFVTAPIGSTFNTESLSAGSSLDAVAGSGTAKKGIESVIEYNGLTLNDPNFYDRYLVKKIEGLFDAEVKDRRVELSNDHGDVPQSSKYGGRTVSIQGKIMAQSREKLLDMVTAMQLAFADLQERPLIFRTGDIRRDFYLDCKKVQPLDISDEQESEGDNHYRNFTITLKASNPFFYSVLTKEKQADITISQTPLYSESFNASFTAPELFARQGYGNLYQTSPALTSGSSFSVTGGKLVEQQLSWNSDFLVKQSGREKTPNNTDVVKVRFSKLPLAVNNTKRLLYPAVNILKDCNMSTPEVGHSMVRHFFLVNATTTTRNISLAGCDYEKTIALEDVIAPNKATPFSPYSKQLKPVTASLEAYPYSWEQLALPVMEVLENWGSFDSPASGALNPSNLGVFSPAVNTDYWFVVAQSKESNYKLVNKRVYSVDPVANPNAIPLASYKYKTSSQGQLGWTGIGSTSSDFNVKLDPSTNASGASLALQNGLNYRKYGWGPIKNYDNSVYDTPNSLINVNFQNNNYSLAPGNGNANTSYQSTDTTTYDDWKTYDRDLYTSGDSANTVLINSGSFQARPIFEISGNMVKPALDTLVFYIQNQKNGKTISFFTDKPGRFIPVGDSLIIDCKRKKAYLKNAGTDYLNLMSFDSSWIDLDVGSNQIKIYGYGMTTAETNIKFQDIYL